METIVAVDLIIVESAASSLSAADDVAWLVVAVAVGQFVVTAIDVELVAAGAVYQAGEGTGVGAGALALNPDNPVVGLVVVLDLLAVSDGVEGEDSAQEWEEESDLFEEHFDKRW